MPLLQLIALQLDGLRKLQQQGVSTLLQQQPSSLLVFFAELLLPTTRIVTSDSVTRRLSRRHFVAISVPLLMYGRRKTLDIPVEDAFQVG